MSPIREPSHERRHMRIELAGETLRLAFRSWRAVSESFAAAIVRVASISILALTFASCTPAIGTYEKTVTKAPADTQSTFLARRSDALGNPHDGRSGIYLVSDGPEALGLRLVLTDRAEKTIDAQYYLLHDDSAGHLFAWQLLRAADRGVRVRLLLDDMDVASYDVMSAALDRHPNIEIRLFNPFRRGFGKNIAMLFEFGRINRRMHNKSMTFDNVATIVGGRNIGDVYFAAREDSNYNDLDVLGVGPIAKEVSASFDAYWNSSYAVPAEVVIQSQNKKLTLDEARQRLSDLAKEAKKTPYGDALSHGIREGITKRDIGLDWVPAELVADPPEKASNEARNQDLVASVVRPFLLDAESEVLVSSAYFVPRKQGEAFLSELSAKGVKVSILANSLDSTDVVPVYGHYARSRETLLKAGVELWELRPDSSRPDRERLGLGLSQSSLHTKAFAVDNRYLFVGSFNWDPRSVWINNEMLVLIESEKLASGAAAAFRERIEANAFRLRLDDTGGIDWVTLREDGAILVYKREPTDSQWRAFMGKVYGLLPIGSQL